MRFRALAAAALLATGATAAPAPVLFVFAHPDDEIIAAPLIARLARRGQPVVLALATAGERGAPADGSIAAGPALASVRTGEAQCSARALGIAPPRFLGFEDGSLGEATRPPGSRLKALGTVIRTLVTETRPRAVVAWGPDGGYGHPDHRLVSAVTSEVVLGLPAPPPLLYISLPAAALAAHPPRLMAWTGTDASLLTVRIPFTAADAAAARTAALCHRSQFAYPAIVDAVTAELEPVLAGVVHLRPAVRTKGNPLK
jgi:LmbE family N-acetylglucosaminyl deacetylase